MRGILYYLGGMIMILTLQGCKSTKQVSVQTTSETDSIGSSEVKSSSYVQSLLTESSNLTFDSLDIWVYDYAMASHISQPMDSATGVVHISAKRASLAKDSKQATATVTQKDSVANAATHSKSQEDIKEDSKTASAVAGTSEYVLVLVLLVMILAAAATAVIYSRKQ